MEVNSFFCGAGGFDLGFLQAGFHIRGAWDFDKFAVQSYKENVGDHIKLQDISELKGEDVPAARGWLFGFPCQDLSIGGKRAGLIQGETRSGMFYEVMRLLGEVEEKPEWILAENVKLLKNYLPTLEAEYDRAGYRMVYTMYNSKYHSVAQNRERYFVLGIRKDLDWEFVFPEEDQSFVPRLEDFLETDVPEKYYLNKPYELYEKPKGSVIGMVTIYGGEQIRRIYDTNQVCPTLTTMQGGNRQPKVIQNGRLRKVTPRECARVQGFPDSYKQVVSDTQFYKQMGNAVTIPVAKFIADAIKTQFYAQ